MTLTTNSYLVLCQDSKKQCNEKHLKKCRKPKSCEKCNSIIEKGDYYYALFATMGISSRGIFNMQTGSLCLSCAKIKGLVKESLQ